MRLRLVQDENMDIKLSLKVKCKFCWLDFLLFVLFDSFVSIYIIMFYCGDSDHILCLPS